MNDHSLSCEFYHSIYTVLFYFVCVCGWEGGRGGGGGSEYLFSFFLNFIL